MEKTKRVQESTCVHSSRSEPLNGVWESECQARVLRLWPVSKEPKWKERSGYALGLELTEVGRIGC